MSSISEKRKRRWMEIGLMALPAIILLTPLLALMVVGSSEGVAGGHSGGAWAFWEPFEHGWPFTFLKRTVYRHHTSRWAIWQGRKEWEPAGAAGDAVFLVAAIAVVTVLSVRRVRQNRVWRLTIRECMAITLLIGVIAAHLGWCIRRGEQALSLGDRLEKLEGNVEFEYCGPLWLRRLGEPWFVGVMQRLPLDSIRRIEVSDVPLADRETAFRLLADVNRPYAVTLSYTKVNEPVLQLFLESLTRCQPEVIELEGLEPEGLSGEPWSAEWFEPLARNPRLREIRFLGTNIEDSAITAILRCRHLRNIDLTSTKVTAEGVQTLLALPELEEISISQTAASAELRKQAAAAGVSLEVE